MRRALVMLLCGLGGCSEVPAASARREAIVGGADAGTSSHTFLLELRFDNGASICSAVLVSPKTLLTAAHCVDPEFHGATTVMVRATNEPDTSMLMNSDMIDVTMMARHPSWSPADQESGFDVAMLLLQRAPVGVTPVALQRVAPTVGQGVEVLGYGRASAGDGASSGTRRRVTVPISAVATNTFTFGSSGSAGICAGDSGGPSFLGASVAGVHSRTMSASCGTGVDIRVDRFVSFIDAFIAANDPPPCAMNGLCSAGCGRSDPDCRCIGDGTCDSSCGGSDPDCACRADGACEASCGAADPDCGCSADSVCARACGLADPDCLDDGQVCSDELHCLGAQCLDDARGFKFCSRACAETSECLADMTCQAGVCRAAPAVSDEVRGGCSGVPVLASALVLLLLRRRRTLAPGSSER